jgi:hypothetical protein
MKVSFAALEPDAKLVLSTMTGIDYTGTDMGEWFCCTVRRGDTVLGVLACEPKTAFDYHFNIALPDHRCLHPRLMHAVFKALFSTAARVSAHIDPANDRACTQAQKLGFVYEGFLRRGLDGVRDAAIFGMLPEDCFWLIPPQHHRKIRREGVHHGISTQTS